jgi:Ca2+-binding EF-hand superfamily protein
MKRLFGSAMGVMLSLAAMQVGAAQKAGSMDANSDGKVCKQEFVSAMEARAQKAGKEFNKGGAEKQFANRDKNGDGFLTGDEVTVAPAKAPKPAADE